MYSLSQQSVSCPYCGEIIDVLVDPQEIGQTYIEDCQVCCAPIVFEVYECAGEPTLVLRRDDE